MSPKIRRIILTTIVCIIVFVLLISNLGNSFKTDIISYQNIPSNVENIKSNWLAAFDQEEYNNTTSNFISDQLKDSFISPYETEKSGSYFQNFSVNIPIEESKSYFEIVSKYGNTIKKYTYGEDFTEDVSGLFKASHVSGRAEISPELKFESYIPEILLSENYSSMSDYDKRNFDQKLIALGINSIVFPTNKEKISDENKFIDSNYRESSNGILKLAVSNEIYNNICYYVEKGCKLKLKSGLKIKKQNLTNVYGQIQGNKKNYNPLIIATFYDGELPSKYKNKNSKTFEPNSYTPSILLECARIIRSQETITPDRTIIFAFLAGKSLDKKGLDAFKKLNLKGDFILLDNIGNSTKLNSSYSKNSKDLSNTINYFTEKNNLKIVSSTKDGYITDSSLHLYGINNNVGLNFDNVYNSYKFILSFIEDECYSLDFITANFREIRSIRRIIRDYTVLASIISLIFITFVVFKYPEIKDSN